MKQQFAHGQIVHYVKHDPARPTVIVSHHTGIVVASHRRRVVIIDAAGEKHFVKPFNVRV